MAKIMKCRFMGMDCDFGVRAETTQAVIEDMYPHAVAAHDCAFTLQEFADRIQAEVRDEEQENVSKAGEGGQEIAEERT